MIPTVCGVATPDRIATADTWLQTNLSAYIQWAKVNNSLFILTFDEDVFSSNNRITTIFTGPMVLGWQYNDTISHHTVLRTIEDIYGLRYACDAVFELPITTCQKTLLTIDEINNKNEE